MNIKNIALWLFIAFVVFGLFNLFDDQRSKSNNSLELTYSQFLDEVEAG